MLAVLAVLGALGAVNSPDALQIANARSTYGYLGAAHPVVEGRLPGDIVYFTFDVHNLKLDELGRASYSTLVEVTDANGNLIFKLGPTNAVAQNYLGGNSQPCSAHLELPLDIPAGPYKYRLTVTDRTTTKSVFLEKTANVLPPAFGLIRIAAFADRETRVPAAPIGVVGESLYLAFAPIGFARDGVTKQPNLDVTLRILDDKQKPTFARPLSGTVNKDVPDDVKFLPMHFGITLNRSGNFTILLEATDRITGKSVQARLPLRVMPQQ